MCSFAFSQSHRQCWSTAIQLARKWGASKIFTTAGTKEKCSFLTEHLKVTKAFNYKEEDWSQGVLDATDGKGVDLVLDFIGASYFTKNVNALARDGRMVMIGQFPLAVLRTELTLSSGMMGGVQLPEQTNIAPM